MLPTLNYDAVLSDPLLLLAGVFLVAGPLVFLVSLIKLISWGRKQKQADAYAELNPFAPLPSTPVPQPETPMSSPIAPAVESLPATKLPPTPEPEPEIFPFPTSAEPDKPEMPMDKTIIMPAGMGEVQGQLEIAFSQIKMLNKKVSQMESELDSVARNVTSKLERNELKELPMNPADFTQKLLKLAEHVIVLEKEVERMKTNGAKKGVEEELSTTLVKAPAISAVSTAPKPPLMPL